MQEIFFAGIASQKKVKRIWPKDVDAPKRTLPRTHSNYFPRSQRRFVQVVVCHFRPLNVYVRKRQPGNAAYDSGEKEKTLLRHGCIRHNRAVLANALFNLKFSSFYPKFKYFLQFLQKKFSVNNFQI